MFRNKKSHMGDIVFLPRPAGNLFPVPAHARDDICQHLCLGNGQCKDRALVGRAFRIFPGTWCLWIGSQ